MDQDLFLYFDVVQIKEFGWKAFIADGNNKTSILAFFINATFGCCRFILPFQSPLPLYFLADLPDHKYNPGILNLYVTLMVLMTILAGYKCL